MAPKGLPSALLVVVLLSCGVRTSGARQGDAAAPPAVMLTVLSEETLRRLRREIDRRQWEAAVDVLDEIAGLGRGALARPDPSREHWVGVWDAVHALLRPPPTGLVGAYRARHDAAAAEAFENAWRLRDWALCSDLADRHFLATGFIERAGRLAAACRAAGDLAAAARIGGRLIESLEPDKWWPALLAQTALSLAQMGRHDDLRALHERVDASGRIDEWIRLGEESMLLSELFVRLERDPPAVDRLSPAPAPRDLRFASEGQAFGFAVERVESHDGAERSYSLRRPEPAPGWAVSLARFSGGLEPAPAVGWFRDGALYLLLEGRLVFAVERMTGRVQWVRSVDDLLR